MAKEKIDFAKNPAVKRWRPDFRYVDSKQEDLEISGFNSTEESVTDKEAYRITLASMRGQLASGSGSINHGNYEIKAGEKYNPNFDFSYFHRPDITIVDIDEATKVLKEQLEKYDGDLKLQIQKELEYATKKRNELVNENKSDTKNSDSSKSE